MDLATSLSLRWRQLLAPFAPEPAQGAAFADLVRRYSDPVRHYHTLDHIRAVLDTVALLSPDASLPLWLAAWLHDAVYDPRAADNEERSADLARSMLPSLNVAGEAIEETARLILLTRRHETDPADVSGQVLLDADLAILAAPGEQYDAYAAAIRREYAWVSDGDFRAGRRRILEAFLARPRIYHTPAMRQQGEARARANLAREVAGLAG